MKRVIPYKNMEKDNPIIKKRFNEKMKRWDKQGLSILISWAVNNAVQTLPEKDKANWIEARGKITERYQFFVDLYREWMLENLPIDASSIKTHPLSDNEVAEANDKWQKKYNALSEQDEINQELNEQ